MIDGGTGNTSSVQTLDCVVPMSMLSYSLFSKHDQMYITKAFSPSTIYIYAGPLSPLLSCVCSKCSTQCNGFKRRQLCNCYCHMGTSSFKQRTNPGVHHHLPILPGKAFHIQYIHVALLCACACMPAWLLHLHQHTCQ